MALNTPSNRFRAAGGTGVGRLVLLVTLKARCVEVDDAKLSEVTVLCIEDLCDEREVIEGGGGGTRRFMAAMVEDDDAVDRVGRILGDEGVDLEPADGGPGGYPCCEENCTLGILNDDVEGRIGSCGGTIDRPRAIEFFQSSTAKCSTDGLAREGVETFS